VVGSTTVCIAQIISDHSSDLMTKIDIELAKLLKTKFSTVYNYNKRERLKLSDLQQQLSMSLICYQSDVHSWTNSFMSHGPT